MTEYTIRVLGSKTKFDVHILIPAFPNSDSIVANKTILAFNVLLLPEQIFMYLFTKYNNREVLNITCEQQALVK